MNAYWFVVVNGVVELILIHPCSCSSGLVLRACELCVDSSVLVEEIVEEVTS